ncbi:MAG TPA: lipoprotein insertase outer membrane protein LolB [Steroidobacteraceae bacterium]|nr:lipoprotein insertase outer membrane protein LolB [Steroidobacteraceae bacterium]
MRWTRAAWVAVMLVFAGCATTGPRVAAPVTSLESLANWQANGRIAVAGAQGGGSGNFEWQQAESASNIVIRGPIGIGSLRVSLNAEHPEHMQLELGDGRKLQADAAWAELEAQLGAPVPAANLRYWLLGLPAPSEYQWLEQGERSAVLLQDGWRIEFLEYTVVNGQRTPSRIKATHGPARIRMLINRWRLGDEARG